MLFSLLGHYHCCYFVQMAKDRLAKLAQDTDLDVGMLISPEPRQTQHPQQHTLLHHQHQQHQQQQQASPRCSSPWASGASQRSSALSTHLSVASTIVRDDSYYSVCYSHTGDTHAHTHAHAPTHTHTGDDARFTSEQHHTADSDVAPSGTAATAAAGGSSSSGRLSRLKMLGAGLLQLNLESLPLIDEAANETCTPLSVAPGGGGGGRAAPAPGGEGGEAGDLFPRVSGLECARAGELFFGGVSRDVHIVGCGKRGRADSLLSPDVVGAAQPGGASTSS